ncbi:cupin domain-containing protein [Amycolatopsis pithecellobii]|uniref:Cupin domain-containing protein n=1 Tax=Amycolatopsis pithecellobii TaxID=664692 RepID=A0A6N7Z1K4_9PSEU|nr:cupin domain-containing protein [Amycolatopsis pithecellobii]MTD54679.1 cupin domain-containing protein [Amycolatopsis pithecellobii]
MTPERERKLVPVRRVVTGHDESGRSTVLSDEFSPHTMTFPGVPDYGQTDLWRTRVPADNTTSGESCENPTMAPPDGGVVFRVVQIPPDHLFLADFDRTAMFGGLPDGKHAVGDHEVRNATMHRTRSVDFAVVLDGEVHAVLEDGEVLLRRGDTLIQRGTLHGWSNRTDSNCQIAFVLVDAGPSDAGEEQQP